MSDANSTIRPTSSPELFKHYAFVIDGDVVWKHSILASADFEMLNAIYSSSPEVVLIPDELNASIGVYEGWTYNGTDFIAPQ